MNYCTRCGSLYQSAGTCNCYATQQPISPAPQIYQLPMPYPITPTYPVGPGYPWTYPYITYTSSTTLSATNQGQA